MTIVGLAAHLSICAELCSRTNAGDTSQYNVVMDEVHFRELFLAATTPPITRTKEQSTASLLMMGFPSRVLAPGGTTSYCACHNKPCREGFLCTRCLSRVCRLPAECPSCSLTLILSTHLARSYHHLFPLRNWVEVFWADAVRSTACFSCQCPFPAVPARLKDGGGSRGGGAGGDKNTSDEDGDEGDEEEMNRRKAKGVSESSRYACEVCGNHFCIDCDVYAHEVIHNCPGCQSNISQQQLQEQQQQQQGDAMHMNGNGLSNGHTNGAMLVDA